MNDNLWFLTDYSPVLFVVFLLFSWYLNPNINLLGKFDDFYRLLEINGFRRIGLLPNYQSDKLILSNLPQLVNKYDRGFLGWFLKKINQQAIYLYGINKSNFDVEAYYSKFGRKKSKLSILRIKMDFVYGESLFAFPNKKLYRYFNINNTITQENKFVFDQANIPLRVYTNSQRIANIFNRRRDLEFLMQNLSRYFVLKIEGDFLQIERYGVITDSVELNRLLDLLLSIAKELRQ